MGWKWRRAVDAGWRGGRQQLAHDRIFYARIAKAQENAEQATQQKLMQAEMADVEECDKNWNRIPPPKRARVASAAGSSSSNAIDLGSIDEGGDVISLSGDSDEGAEIPPAEQKLRLRLVLPARRLQLFLPSGVELIYVLCAPRVQTALLALLDQSGGLSALALAERFELVRNYSVDDTGPRHASFNKQAMQSTSLGEALGMQAGNLHVRLASSARVQRSSSTPFVPSPLGVIDATSACDSVVVVRLRASHDRRAAARLGAHFGRQQNYGSGPSFGSPVLLVKNYRRDRGLSLMRELGVSALRSRVAHGVAAQGTASVANPQLLHQHAEAVLGLCASLDIIRKDEAARKALKNEQHEPDPLAWRGQVAAHHGHGYGYGWMPPVGLAYPRGSTLPHHIDGMGRWVVLFSFGLSCDFHAGGRTLTIESGDALVFNGGPAHAVMHGLDRVHEAPSLGGESRSLPDGMLEQLGGCRVSIQVRQL
mmetsp:Transcript_25864/g.78333  ORF Transcript_25864/g.78333 Transcript_25864/m.78333 type:complete len:480 (-) Transcript_25864:171-1610(-)